MLRGREDGREGEIDGGRVGGREKKGGQEMKKKLLINYLSVYGHRRQW